MIESRTVSDECYCDVKIWREGKTDWEEMGGIGSEAEIFLHRFEPIIYTPAEKRRNANHQSNRTSCSDS